MSQRPEVSTDSVTSFFVWFNCSLFARSVIFFLVHSAHSFIIIIIVLS